MKNFYDSQNKNDHEKIILETNKKIIKTHFRADFIKEEDNIQRCSFGAYLKKNIPNTIEEYKY